jgi:hypothetical protein
MGSPGCVEQRPRLTDRSLPPGRRRVLLITWLGIWLALVVAGCVVGYELGNSSDRLVTTGLGAATGMVMTLILTWVFVIFVSIKRDEP